jgi:hypothetical protein
MRPYLEKLFIKIGLVEWLKVKALSSNPSIANNNNKIICLLKNKKRKQKRNIGYETNNKHIDVN